MSVAGLRIVWPIHFHFSSRILTSTGLCLLRAKSSSLKVHLSGHHMRSMALKQRFIQVWIFLVVETATDHVSQSCSSTDFEVKILIFVLVVSCFENHMLLSIAKYDQAFVIPYSMPVLALFSCPHTVNATGRLPLIRAINA